MRWVSDVSDFGKGNDMAGYTNAAYNAAHDILIKWSSETFVIIGDDSKVSDEELNQIIFGESLPIGWAKAPATHEEAVAAYGK